MLFCINIYDLATLLISISGLVLAAIYLCSACDYHEDCDEKLKDKLVKWINANDKNSGTLSRYEKLNIVLKDYETSNNEIQRRDNITLLIGSILIVSSLFILANASLSEESYLMTIYAFASIGLYVIWLWSIHYTSKKLDSISYKRIGAIEGALSSDEKSWSKNYDFGIHSYLIRETRRNSQTASGKESVRWLKWLRRPFWGYILVLLCLAWILLSLT